MSRINSNGVVDKGREQKLTESIYLSILFFFSNGGHSRVRVQISPDKTYFSVSSATGRKIELDVDKRKIFFYFTIVKVRAIIAYMYHVYNAVADNTATAKVGPRILPAASTTNGKSNTDRVGVEQQQSQGNKNAGSILFCVCFYGKFRFLGLAVINYSCTND